MFTVNDVRQIKKGIERIIFGNDKNYKRESKIEQSTYLTATKSSNKKSISKKNNL
jgi:hypothetical protein